jgi:alpha-glucosidase
MNKRFLIITILAAGLTNTSWADKQEKLASPNGKIVANINIGKELTYSASFNGEQIQKDCPLSLQVGQKLLGINPKLSNTKRTKIDEQVQQATPSTQLTLHLVRNGGWCGSFEK